MNSQVAQLLATAQADDILTPGSASIFTGNIGIHDQIQQALGLSANLFQPADGVLLTILVDDSYSIHVAGNEDVIIDGVGTLIDAVESAQVQNNVLVHTTLLNGKIINPYVPLSQAQRLDRRNYSGNGGTPLYDSIVTTLGTVILKATELRNAGIPVQTVTVIVTDGRDEHSLRYGAKDVKTIVDDMLKYEDNVVTAMGISDGHTDFNKVFREMGLLDKWILTPANSHKEIRAAFRMVSQQASQAVSGAAAFSQVALGGGFAAP